MTRRTYSDTTPAHPARHFLRAKDLVDARYREPLDVRAPRPRRAPVARKGVRRPSGLEVEPDCVTIGTRRKVVYERCARAGLCGKFWTETPTPTREAAEKVELQLKLRRVRGEESTVEPTTLGQEIDGFLDRLRATGGLRPRSLEFYEHKAKVWKPLRGMRVSALRRTRVEDFIVTRAAKHPRSAVDELQFLKRVLKDARGRGQKVDEAIFEIRPVKHVPRRGRALTVDELCEFASWFPEHVSRLILLAGQIGARQSVWFALTEDMLDLKAGIMETPGDFSKNRRDHRVYLTSVEVSLFREQLLARATDTRLLFPNGAGEQWDRSRFREQVWARSVEAAAKHDRERSGRGSSIFEGFTFHMLRHTAGSLMALAGLDPAVACERLGHSDGGALFLKTYRHLYEGEKRVQAARLDAMVRASLDAAWTEEGRTGEEGLTEAVSGDGRTWDRTRRMQAARH